MAINDFYKKDDLKEVNKEEMLKKVFDNIKKDKNISDFLANKMAEKIVFRPEHLLKIKLNSEQKIGIRPGITFYFDNAEPIKLIAKYFSIHFTTCSVNDSQFLIDLLNVCDNAALQKVGYDFDGVICGKREAPKIPYMKLDPERRKQYIEEKRNHYKTTEILTIPIEKDFFIITGRSKKYYTETMEWLKKNNIIPKDIFFNSYGCTFDGNVKHKSEAINKLSITKFYEDDEKVIKQLKKLCPNTTIILIEGVKKCN